MRWFLTAFCCLLLIVPAAFAQSDRGTVTGTVTDPAGAMIPNAELQAKNLGTGATYQTMSTETGNYTLPQLPAGTYQMSASAAGFKQFVRTGITVMVATTLRIDIQLEVGDITETVTVSADAPLLKTESGEMSHNITTERLDDLPLLSVAGGVRSSYAQVNLLPGAGQIGGGFGTLRVNGMPGATLSLRIEGQDATQTAWTTAYGMSQPGVDSIEETAIQTSNFAAEYGQAGGGVFNMTMRSGTQMFHGSAFLYWRNEALNAFQPFDKREKDRDRREDYGFTAGGPVYIPKLYDGRDKTFFFFSFENNPQTLTSSLYQTVPTMAYRQGDFSNPSLYTQRVLGTDPLGREILDGTIYDPATTRLFGGQIVRDQFMGCDGQHPNVICREPGHPNFVAYDPVAEAFQKLIPEPTELGKTTENYYTNYVDENSSWNVSVKADHNISSKLKLSGYWARYDIVNPFPDGFAPPITTERDIVERTNTVRVSMDYTISPTMLMSLGAGLMHFKFTDDVPNTNYDNLKELGLPGTFASIPPTFYYLGTAQGGGLGSGSGQGNSAGPVAQQQQWQIKPTGTASLTWVKSNHSLKFGGELRIESYPSTVATPANGWFYFSSAQTALPYLQTASLPGGGIGFPYASFLLGQIDRGEIGQYSRFHVGKHALAFYAQDSWKITPRLTLDYGLRWDYQTYLREQYGRLPSFGYDTPNPAYDNIPGAVIFERDGTQFADNYKHAWGPRLGLAYQFMPKTVLRAGIGISYGQTGNLEMWSLRFGSLDRYGTGTFGLPAGLLQNGPNVDGNPVVPVWPDLDPGSRPITTGDPFMTSIDQNAGRPPRQLMWSIGVQREITPNLSLEVSYVGNRGVWWMSNGALTDPNRVTPEILAANGLSLSSQADRDLLLKPITHPDVVARGFTKPFSSFPDGGSLSQALRPYPQFSGIFVLWAPLGNTWYDSLQVKLTKRYSYGLDFTAAYSYQKELTVGAETFDPAFAPVQPAINDLNDLRSNKVISGLSIPHRLVIGLNYTTPRFDLPKTLSWLIRDWRFGAVLTYESGRPIHVPISNNNIGTLLSLCAPQSVFGGCNTSPYFNAPASHMNRVPGEPLFTQELNEKYDPFTTFVLNPDAWETPPAGEYGKTSAYLSDYRYARTPNENLSLGRIFRFREGMNLQIRVELMNAFNRTRIPTPDSTYSWVPQVRNPDGTTASGFGRINAINAGGQRTGQIVARFTF